MDVFNIIAGICSILGLIIAIFTILPELRRISLGIRKNNLKKCSVSGPPKTTDKKGLNKNKYMLIKEIYKKEPEIYYDNGLFNIGWNWFINNISIMKIEKHFFCYKYALWVYKGEENGQPIFGYTDLKKFNQNNIKNDKDLKERIIWAENIFKQNNGI